jgi:hypothetical protein
MRPSRPLAILLAVLLVIDVAAPVAPLWAQEEESVGPTDDPAPQYQSWTPWVSTTSLPAYYLDHSLFSSSNLSGALKFPMDPRVMHVQVDPYSEQVTTHVAAADVLIGQHRSESFDEYASRLTASNLRKGWVNSSRTRINQTETQGPSRVTGLTIALPVEMPSVVQSILGTGAPQINVSGSERISIAGRSNWTNQENVFGRGQSLFPQLDMRQDLQINLSGQLGSKVNVDIVQASVAQTVLSNKVALRYNGEDDEVIRKLHLGNTQLTLPGTQYVSYSGRNDGLFGVMTEARIGDTDLALVASKQEGRSERSQYVGTSLTRNFSIDDWQYIERTYFFLKLPDTMVDQDGFLLPDAPRIDVGSIEVFVDDRIDQNLEGERPGYAELRPPRPGTPVDSIFQFGKFDRKEPIRDFEVKLDYFGAQFPVLVLSTPVPENSTLAVLYNDSNGPVGGAVNDTLRLQLLKVPLNDHVVVDGRFTEDPSIDPFGITREYELRSFYNLGAPNLDPQTTEIQVRRLSGGGQLEFVEQFTEDATGLNITYLEVTGVDILNQTQGGTPIAGQDGIVDQFTNANWVDWQNGIMFLPDLRPFAPRLNRPSDKYFARSRAALEPPATRRAFLSLDPDAQIATQGNSGAYDIRNDTQRRDARTFTIFIEYSSSSGGNTIVLRNAPIYDGSEIVTVNGETLIRDQDYTINYQTGMVQLTSERARAGGGQVSIDYSYAPLFAQASKTLIGSSLGLINKPSYGLGAAFIYESRGQQERRPRVGEEPTKTVIGDIHGRLDIKPKLMTALADMWPFYRGRDESRLQVTGEMGYSIPNPNTRNEVYIDDFEGTRISAGGAMDARSWFPPSVPKLKSGAADVPVTDSLSTGQLIWYNPFNVIREGDLRPTLSRAEDRDAPVSVLSWWVPQSRAGAVRDSALWVGLIQPLDRDGVDMSRSQFIDLWMNDFRNPTLRDGNVRINIEIGTVSEDAQHFPDLAPNGRLDTEDQEPRDRQLDATEDTGVDSVFSIDEAVTADPTDRINASPEDPHGDDWRPPDEDYENERDPRRWRFNNGTERNQNYRGIPDTEDLDADGQLDLLNSYFKYSFVLTDTTFLDTDVYEDFKDDPQVLEENRPGPGNGWRRFLIPLDAAAPYLQVVGNPDLHSVKHMRVWLDGVKIPNSPDMTPGVPTLPLIEFAQLDVVGNRWIPSEVDPEQAVFGQQVAVRAVNNREDKAIYKPPFEIETQSVGGSTVEQREQSLAIEVKDLVPGGGELSAFRTTTLPEDYSRYRAMNFWLSAFEFPDSLEPDTRFFIRFVSDGGGVVRNYYEYNAPIPDARPLNRETINWQSYDIPLTDLSSLKIGLSLDSLSKSIGVPGQKSGIDSLKVVGTPSFTRIQRVVIGLQNARPIPALPTFADTTAFIRSNLIPKGQIWIDELRAVDVDRDRGVAGRLGVVGNFSDLANFTFNVNAQDENFIRLGQARGTGINSLTKQFNGTVRMEKLFGGLGFQVPVNIGLVNTQSVPRFITGQDIELPRDEAEAQKTTRQSRSLSGSISHSGSRGWVLRNSLDALSFQYSMSDAKGLTPVSSDTTRTLQGRGTYALRPSEWFSLPLPLIKSRGRAARLNILPTSTSVSFAMTTRRTIAYDRARDGTGDFASRLGLIYSKTAFWNLAATWQPISILGYSLSSVRNANLPGIEPARIGNINFGRQTNFNQRFDLRLPIKLGAWISPDVDANTTYAEDRTPELSRNLSLGNFRNSLGFNVRWTFPFRRLAPRPDPADTTGSTGFGIPLGKLLSKLGDVQTRASYSRTTAFSVLSGYPAISYRLGLARDPGFWTREGDPGPSVERTALTTENSQRTISGEASSTIALWGRATARARINYNNILRTSNLRSYVQETFSMPDITVDWGPVQNIFRLSGIFPTLTANTRFARNINRDGVYNAPISSRTVNNGWQPLLSFSGTTKSGIQTTLAGEITTSLRQDFRNSLNSAVSTDTRSRNVTIRGNISKTFTAGSRFSLFGLLGSTLRSTLTLQLNTSFNKRTGGTEVPGVERLGGEIDNDRVEVQTTGTYTFSRNISGTVGLGFSQFRDFTRDVTDRDGKPKGTLTQRSIRLEASASMRF